MLPPATNPLAAFLLGATESGSQYFEDKKKEKQRLNEILLSENLKTQREVSKQKAQSNRASEQTSKMKDVLVQRGVDPKLADLYANAPTGGQTEILKYILDMEQRGAIAPGTTDVFQNTQTDVFKNNKGNEVEDQISMDEFSFPKLPQKRLKPAEMFKEQTVREKSNTPFYKSSSDKLSSLDKNTQIVGRLRELEETNKLPEGFDKWNVDWKTGDIRVPALATPEAQEFVKIITDFTTQAKDSFGARISNFELDRFLKRLPTLANSKEGRQAIYNYMDKINQIDRLKEEALIETFNHYGIENINYQQANQIAKKYMKDKEKKLLQEVKKEENAMKSISDSNRKELKKELGKAPTGFTYMISDTGDVEQVPNSKVNEAIRNSKYEIL